MRKCALSDRVKRHKKHHIKDFKLKLAVMDYKANQLKPKKDQCGGCAIADKHGMEFSTLMYHTKRDDAPTMSESNAMKQKLMVAEEWVLVDFIKGSADYGLPLAHRAIKAHANATLCSCLGSQFDPVGKQWIFRFLNRHHDELQTHWSKPLDMQRAKCLNPDAVKSWFDLAWKHIVAEGILAENIYGMDESGFPPANRGSEHVVGQRGTKTQHKQGGADRENVTVLVTIRADGSALSLIIIYKGQNFMVKWGENNVA
jgi:hypothetical protein